MKSKASDDPLAIQCWDEIGKLSAWHHNDVIAIIAKYLRRARSESEIYEVECDSNVVRISIINT